jgi:mRNA interferase MazF
MKPRRGEIWLTDLGMIAKTRPVLVLSVSPLDIDRDLVSYVMRTTSLRGTQYEIPHNHPAFKPGAFDAQSIATTVRPKLLRKLGDIDSHTLSNVESALKQWLSLEDS